VCLSHASTHAPAHDVIAAVATKIATAAAAAAGKRQRAAVSRAAGPSQKLTNADPTDDALFAARRSTDSFTIQTVYLDGQKCRTGGQKLCRPSSQYPVSKNVPLLFL